MNISPHVVTVGNLLFPLSRILYKDGKPINLASYTVKFAMVDDDGVSVVAETATGVTAHPTTTFTADATTDRLTANGHPVSDGDEIIVSNSGGSLPGGLAASTRYFARDVSANAMRLAAVPGGSAIDITSAGSGTHSLYVVGHVQYAFAAADVDTAGVFWGWFVLLDGSSNKQHVPQEGRRLKIEIVAAS